MNDTPMTDEAYSAILNEAHDSAEPLQFMLYFSRTMERNLNEANARISKIEDSAILGAREANRHISALNERIKRLEEAGDALSEYDLIPDHLANAWNKAKE